MKIIIPFLLSLLLNIPAFAKDTIDSFGPFLWALSIDMLTPSSGEYKNTAINSLIENGYKSEKLGGITCKLDFSKGIYPKGMPYLSEIYFENIDLSCKVNGVEVKPQSVGCIKTGDGAVETTMLQLKANGQNFSLHILCREKKETDK